MASSYQYRKDQQNNIVQNLFQYFECEKETFLDFLTDCSKKIELELNHWEQNRNDKDNTTFHEICDHLNFVTHVFASTFQDMSDKLDLKARETGYGVVHAAKTMECNKIAQIEAELSNVLQRAEAIENSIGNVFEKIKETEKLSLRQIQKQSKLLKKQITEIDKQAKKIENLSKLVEDYKTNLVPVIDNLNSLKKETDDLDVKVASQSTLIANLKDKIDTSERGVTEVVEDLHRKYGLMCKLVQKRIFPVEKLLELFKTNTEERNKRSEKLQDMEDDVATLVCEFKQFRDRKWYSSIVGFMVSDGKGTGLLSNKFTTVHCNIGNYFDVSTGTFTAPLDGLYFVMFTVTQQTDTASTHVLQHKSGPGTVGINDASLTRKGSSAAKSSFVWMKKSDLLFLECRDFQQANYVYNNFACSLLGV